MNPAELEHLLTRTVVIRARRSTVFRYFTDSARFAAWWGPGSRIDPRPGGEVRIQYPGGVVAGGEVIEIAPERRVVFSYGYQDPQKPIAWGASRVTVDFEDHAEGTLVRLSHAVADPAVRDAHGPGWRYQLSLFANVVTAESTATLPALLDRFFALWSLPDDGAVTAALAALTTADVTFRDRFAALAGRDDLAAHLAALRIHMPGARLERDGEPRACQGTVLCDWRALGPDGTARGQGTNTFELDPDGRIARVVGFWR